MRYFVGVGSNLGSRRENINKAEVLINRTSAASVIKKSYIYENPAMVPCEVKENWNKPFLNCAFEVESSDEPLVFLRVLKSIEKEMGRVIGARWAPRIIDLDILLCDERAIDAEELKIPHVGIKSRPFVLAPLRDLIPDQMIDGENILTYNRKLRTAIPAWMGIVNVTNDSFSDGGLVSDQQIFWNVLSEYVKAGVSIVDIGAESTRPGASIIDGEVEWQRLESYLKAYNDFKKNHINAPALSVDTRNSSVAEKAIEWGAQIINDVSGMADPKMKDVIKSSDCQYIFMHSLTIPADPKIGIEEGDDPVEELDFWLEGKLNFFEKNNIPRKRLLWDPGIGFGKNSQQSLRLLKNIKSFDKYNIRSLVGHSRKSFMKNFSSDEAKERDLESVGVSLMLAESGVDIVRVHNPVLHMRTHRGWSHVI